MKAHPTYAWVSRSSDAELRANSDWGHKLKTTNVEKKRLQWIDGPSDEHEFLYIHAMWNTLPGRQYLPNKVRKNSPLWLCVRPCFPSLLFFSAFPLTSLIRARQFRICFLFSSCLNACFNLTTIFLNKYILVQADVKVNTVQPFKWCQLSEHQNGN